MALDKRILVSQELSIDGSESGRLILDIDDRAVCIKHRWTQPEDTKITRVSSFVTMIRSTSDGRILVTFSNEIETSDFKPKVKNSRDFYMDSLIEYIDQLWVPLGPKVTYFDDAGPYHIIEKKDDPRKLPFPVLAFVDLEKQKIISLYNINPILIHVNTACHTDFQKPFLYWGPDEINSFNRKYGEKLRGYSFHYITKILIKVLGGKTPNTLILCKGEGSPRFNNLEQEKIGKVL